MRYGARLALAPAVILALLACTEGDRVERQANRTAGAAAGRPGEIADAGAPPESQAFAAIDAHALRAPRAAERSLDALAAYLAGPARSETERARAIYRWLADRIRYDAEAYFSGRFRDAQREPADVLRTRQAVCDGYAELFVALARRMGLEAETVPGYAKGWAYRPGARLPARADHAWNAVRIDGAWRLLDATWGAGTLDAETRSFQRRFEPHFFLTPPERFVQRHLPEQPRWQLLPSPLDRAAFAALAVPSPVLFRHGLVPLSHSDAVIVAAGEVELRFAAPPGVRLTAKLLRDGPQGRPVAGHPTFIERDGPDMLLQVRPPHAGTYALQVFSKDDPAASVYEGALEYTVQATAGVGGGAGFPETFRPFAEREGRLVQPRRGRLPAGSEQRFRLSVPGAEAVVVAAGDRLLPLRAVGGAFEGTIRVPRGTFIVYARFAGAAGYAGLLRYEGA